MGRISNTIELAKSSWAVLRSDTELLLLPLISGIASLLVAASFMVPIYLSGGAGDVFDGGEVSLSAAQYAGLFVMYLVLSFITVFFNAALISGANERLQGGDPSVRSALAGAMKHVGSIAAWSVVAAVVSTILRAIEERSGLLGRLIVGVIGLAWALVTFLVLPAIVIEGVGVRDAFRRSTELFKGTWGEQVAANVGFGLIGLVGALAAAPVIVLAAVSGSSVALGVAIGLAVIWLVVLGVVVSALSGVFQTALYHYAVTGAAPGQAFDQAQLAASFRPRTGRR